MTIRQVSKQFLAKGILFFVLSQVLAISCVQDNRFLNIISEAEKKTIFLRDLKNKLKTIDIKIDDYYFKKKMRYEGFNLYEFLQHIKPANETWDEIVFRCADGYSPSVSRAFLDSGKAADFYLVFREMGRPGFTSIIENGKAKVSPAPFYITGKTLETHNVLPWPFQLVTIEFVKFEKKFPAVFPKNLAQNANQSAIKEGFMFFRKNCFTCHSMNLQGGDLGPELNIPRNITEYRNLNDLRAFIRKPESFRARSKMPGFDLSNKQMAALVAYFRAMREHKIKNP